MYTHSPGDQGVEGVCTRPPGSRPGVGGWAGVPDLCCCCFYSRRPVYLRAGRTAVAVALVIGRPGVAG